MSKINVYNYAKLHGRIKELYNTQSNFAKQIGLSPTSLSKKLNNKTEFSQNEIANSLEALHLEINDIPTYFFMVGS